MHKYLVLLSFFICLLGLPTLAQEVQPQLEKGLPQSTIFFFSVPDIKGVAKDFQQTDYWKLINLPEFQKFFAPIMPFAEKGLEELDQELRTEFEIGLFEAISIFGGEISVALADFEIKENAPPYIKLVFALNLAGNLEKGKQFVDKFMSKFQLGEPQTLNGIQFQVIQGLPQQIYVGFAGTTLLVGSDNQTLENVLKSAQAPTKDSLIEVPGYKVLGKPGCIFKLYLSLANLLEKLHAQIPPPVLDIMDRSGLSCIRSIGLFSGFQDNDIYHMINIEAPGERKGLLRMFASAPLSKDLANYIPSKAFSYEFSSIDLMTLWNEINDIVQLTPIASEFQGTIKSFETKTGISIKDDLLASIGNDFASYASFPETRGILTEYVLMLKLKDAKRFLTTIEKLVQASGMLKLLSISYRESTIWYLDTVKDTTKPMLGDPDPQQIIGATIGFFPRYFVIEKDNLFIANTSQTLKRHLYRLQSGMLAKDNLGSHWDERIPAGVYSVSFLDTPQGISFGYNSLISIAAPFSSLLKLAPIPFDIDFSVLPISEDFIHYIHPLQASVKSDKEAITMEIRGSLVLGMVSSLCANISVGTTGIVTAMIIPALSSVKEKANQSKCKSNLKQIGVASQLCMNEYGKGVKFPDSLEELYTKQVMVEPQVFLCPSCSPYQLIEGKESSNFRTHYKWAYNNKLNIPRTEPYKTMIAFCNGHPDVVIVLFMDGHVESVHYYEFQTMFEERKELCEKNGFELTEYYGITEKKGTEEGEKGEKEEGEEEK